MGKITQEQRNRYFEKVKEHRKTIEAGLAKEKTLGELVAKDANGTGYKRLALAESTLDLCSWYVLINTLSVSLLGIKNEDYLIEARKVLVRSIKYLEDTVSPFLDSPFSDYEAKLEEIKDFDPDSRYRLVRKLGFAVQSLEDAFGDNSKYSASFIEIWGKMAAVSKNLVNLKTAIADTDFNSPVRNVVLAHLGLVKSLFQRSADKYREQYELYTHKQEDFKKAIVYLQSLRRLHVVLAEREEADTLKKKIEIWSSKLEADQKRADEHRK
ncbi:MAG TPA: hypothetical protein PLB91_15690 [Spirochaetales bacterium]|nr:hypothetical protein [Spirochaetales bacterium]HRY53442.1 hypothetical protein [Spirochaetia bacterium]HRZ65126.1 hypothetical protein [Spirochaetia bacterium]